MIRSVRNNNPGNLNKGQPWQGLMPAGYLNPEQAHEDRFAVFKSSEWGFRAMCVILRNYQTMHGISTVNDVIRRWAPPFENNTAAYTQAVAREMGVGASDKLNLLDRETVRKLAKAIARHETGGWDGLWKDTDLDRGLTLANF
jgi:hypothetical protein